MNKILKVLVDIIFWLQAFASPFFLAGLIALFIYIKSGNRSSAIILVTIGVISGIFLAEFIRRKYGLDNFFGKIYGSGKLEKKGSSNE